MSVADPAGVAPAHAAIRACRHCGSPLPTEAARSAGFCCAGCAYVHQLVHDGGLDRYYRLKDRVIAPAGSALFQMRDYAWLEAARRDAEAAAAADPRPGAAPELVLDIQGISCVGCVWLIERLFERSPGARRIEINAQLGRMRLRWQAGAFDAVGFARTLQSFNYFVGPPAAGSEAPAESRDLAKRIGLCAAFAMNIMLFTLPAYFGMDASFPYARLFATLAMLFGTLSFLSGGSYFIGRAVSALRERVLHIDLPIALGIAGAYAGSAYGWIAGDARFLYFDFVGTFILLMLIGRWAQVAAVERNRRRLLSHRLQLPPVRMERDGEAAAPMEVERIGAGRAFALPAGHVLPVDGRLAGGDAVFTLAWINGESEPRLFHAGQRVPAGAVNAGRGAVKFEALQGWADSALSRLLKPEVRPGARHRAFERIIQGYLVGIVGLALASGAGWAIATGDVARALSVAAAVLVVSCPCTLGLALPLADELAVAALRGDGVFVREHDLWTRLGRVRRVVFDKTGTLTFEAPALANPADLRALSAEDRAALCALVRENPHPVSQCLHEALLFDAAAAGAPIPDAAAAPSDELREEIGFGVSLCRGADVWSLGRPGWRAAPGAQVTHYVTNPELPAGETELRRNGAVLARFRFIEAARPDARAEIAALTGSGFDVFILSGDRQAKVDALAAELGLPPGHAVGEASPEAKAAWIKGRDRRDTLMLGDGANDSLAFESAWCRGTPVVHRGVLESKADFYMLGRGIGGIRRLFEVERLRARTQREVILFAITYNAAAVGCAAAGLVNPLVAAVLMPLSALTSLAIALLGMRRRSGGLRGSWKSPR